jgi:ribulose 1,5-bisphosphate synthetase/thiazole synthase
MTLKKFSKHGSINYNLPIGAEADVIVAGSGPTGISASGDIAVSLQ